MFGKRFWLRELPAMVVGTGMMALAVNAIYEPLGMVPGGFSGLAILLHEGMAVWFGRALSVGVINLMLNIPVFIWAFAERGGRFVVKSLLANLIFSGMLLWIPVIPLAQKDYFLAAIVGGVLTGGGIGLVFSVGLTTGGTDLLGNLIRRHFPQFSVATILFLADAVIIGMGALYFGIAKAAYATVAVYISSKIMDGILSGVNRNRQVLFISEKWQEIATQITDSIDRGVTCIQAKGYYTDRDRPVIMCVVGRRQIGDLLRIIRTLDRQAFVIVADVREVLGEGFNSMDF